MASPPLISVCLPTYNASNYLEGAIESVLAQTHTDFELLISDDQSPDQTLQIAEKYKQQDARVKYWQNEKRLGLFENYNENMRRANGKYIKPFAHDDLFEPTALARMVAVLEEEPQVALVNCARQWIDETGAVIELRNDFDRRFAQPFAKDMRLSLKEVALDTLRDAVNWLGEPVSMMFRKAQWCEGFDGRFVQLGDIDYWYRILGQGDLVYLAEPLCKFRRHSSQHTAKVRKTLESMLDWLLLASKHRALLGDIGETERQFASRFAQQFLTGIADDLSVADRSLLSKYSRLLENDPMLDSFDPNPANARNYLAECQSFCMACLDAAARVEQERRSLATQSSELQDRVAFLQSKQAGKQTEIEVLSAAAKRKESELNQEVSALNQEVSELTQEIVELREALSEVGNSLSWKLTAALRKAKRLL